MTNNVNIAEIRNGSESSEPTFVPSWKKAAISAALFILPIITFGFTGMVVL